MNAPDAVLLPTRPSRRARLVEALQREPYRFDLFTALRRIEAVHPEMPRLGDALRPADEPVRIAQEASLTFAPSAVTALRMPPAGPPHLVQRVFGLLGPNGPLPTHLTEYVHDRAMHHGDATLQRFCDLLAHRFALLFYKTWARAQPVVGLDRPADSRIARHLGALSGLQPTIGQVLDGLGHESKLFFSSRLARSVRDADGLRAWIAGHFGVPVRIDECQGHWMPLAESERSRLTRHGQAGLGRGAVLGKAVWDVQHKFRIVIGPLDWDGYRRLLPDEATLDELRAIVRQYVGFEFEWDLRLVLHSVEVPRWRLGAAASANPGPDAVGRLGRTCWIGKRRSAANDLVINIEHLARRRPRPASPASQRGERA